MEKLNIFRKLIDNFVKNNKPISLANISMIAQWNSNYPDKHIDLKTRKGAIFLFFMSALFNYGGGGKGKEKELLTYYNEVYRDNISTKNIKIKNPVRKKMLNNCIKFIDKISNKKTDNILKNWWSYEKKQTKTVTLAALEVIKKLQNIKFDSGRKNKNGKIIYQYLLTSKAFMITRELHIHKV